MTKTMPVIFLNPRIVSWLTLTSSIFLSRNYLFPPQGEPLEITQGVGETKDTVLKKYDLKLEFSEGCMGVGAKNPPEFNVLGAAQSFHVGCKDVKP